MGTSKNKTRLCPKCTAKNEAVVYRCSACGFPLKASKNQRRSEVPRLPYLVAAGTLVLLVSLVLILLKLGSNKEPTSAPVAVTSEPSPTFADEKVSRRGLKTIGRISFLDLSGEEISGMDAAVVAGSWIAVPTWLGFNAHTWQFRSQRNENARIDQGTWKLGDPVGLWRCQKRYDSPDLKAWEQLEALSWHSYVSGGSLENVRVASPQHKGSFLSVALPRTIQEPGVFLQQGRVVGWSFGNDMQQGFMWNGPDGNELEPELGITEFYNQTFSNVQEAQFSRALALSMDSPAQEKLEALAQGFRLLPRLDEEDKPFQLQPDYALDRMQKYASELMKDGFAQEVLDILDEQIVLETADLRLLRQTTQALAKTMDYRNAMEYYERLKHIQIETGRLISRELDLIQLQMCKEWIRESIDNERAVNGWSVFEAAKKTFPDEPELQLLGTELALSERDWNRAESLLNEGTYPLNLRNRAQNLEVLITAGKRDEGVVQIRFVPGQNQIPVEAYLHGKLKQKFVIDTGASLVTIPYETAEVLGIQLNDNTPLVQVSTASGVGLAYEVILDSIEIKGLRVRQVKAIVLDIPAEPGLGLLGNSFLKHFHVEIDQQKGILRLKER